MGWKAGTTVEASFDMKFIVAEITIQQYMAHGPSLICHNEKYGALWWYNTSLPAHFIQAGYWAG